MLTREDIEQIGVVVQSSVKKEIKNAFFKYDRKMTRKFNLIIRLRMLERHERMKN